MGIPYVTFMKHAEKVTKKASASRPTLKGVYHAEDGSLAVTDSHRLYYATDAHQRQDAAILDPKTGEEIGGAYPDVTRLLPYPGDARYTLTIDDIPKALKIVKALEALGKSVDSDGTITIKADENGAVSFGMEAEGTSGTVEIGRVSGGTYENVAVSAQYLSEALALFKDIGVTSVQINSYGKIRPLTLTIDGLTALIMPVRKF
ncbi:hypothetical protein AB1K91_17810 [Terribacillus sp. 179-K 1B1 HS]|uniref:hypothetical protein n=1 Tax=Terribacillus sp. 179-K 1B1 HS TaxID=3142388 RepID=UPI0039A14133